MIRINDELKKILPPLTKDEREGLEKSILAEGVREPLIVWDGTLIDGHNRYELAQKHNLDFETKEKKFDNLDEAKVWIIDNNKSRRNLTDGWKWELAQVKRDILLKEGKGKQGERTDLLSTLDKKLKEDKHDTRGDISKELGWGKGKVARAERVWNRAEPEVAKMLRLTNVRIYQLIKEGTIQAVQLFGKNSRVLIKRSNVECILDKLKNNERG